MLADQSLLHAAITACLVHVQVGSLVWFWVYCRGRLVHVYATELTGAGDVLDFIGNALITLVLICGWPFMLIALRKGKLQ
ncbi:hypothetical protein PMI42_04818 [Bradyrhizobium sp. YR681]|uniref:hypothetical protein n=1 Tax=Bradyrhizobium sp. YR681 TaxID=1144344 RepID=UPI0002710D18|nr:hypothetical protein [Bradyrhizobium sp. YR681]EJN11804.1 hypothetical protein PMI42_04818 [Bradyrhizobium sp. YR681]